MISWKQFLAIVPIVMTAACADPALECPAESADGSCPQDANITEEQAHAEIEAIFKNWFEALLRHDVAFFERTLDDKWVYTNIDGNVLGKEDYIELLESIPPDVSITCGEVAVRLHDDIAIAFGYYTVSGVLTDGTDVTSSTRFTSVWKRAGGAWRSLAHHATNTDKPT
ncbi:MAG TPA: nuclear transport factor 2 family protein [Polyangiaceae bacterium]|jgi:ketosteroid isomerase-like protein|nr:nuclear transport factor 2 family protein [Polyangiaceae bacterium]